MEKDEMLKQRKANYEKWFGRWIKNYDLKKRITIANNKNNTFLSIQIHNIKSERDKAMMRDDRFVLMLNKEFCDFKISRKKELRNINMFSMSMGKAEINTVYIDWS